MWYVYVYVCVCVCMFVCVIAGYIYVWFFAFKTKNEQLLTCCMTNPTYKQEFGDNLAYDDYNNHNTDQSSDVSIFFFVFIFF